MIGKLESEALSSTTQGNLHSVQEELSELNGTWNNDQIDIRIIIIISFATFPLRFRKIQIFHIQIQNVSSIVPTYLATNDITTSVQVEVGRYVSRKCSQAHVRL